MPSMQPDKSYKTDGLSSSDHDDDSNSDDFYFDNKKKVECICPKCGQKHKMTLHWIGRGIPRKYCALCKAGS
jgi:hypothetical protein